MLLSGWILPFLGRVSPHYAYSRSTSAGLCLPHGRCESGGRQGGYRHAAGGIVSTARGQARKDRGACRFLEGRAAGGEQRTWNIFVVRASLRTDCVRYLRFVSRRDSPREASVGSYRRSVDGEGAGAAGQAAKHRAGRRARGQAATCASCEVAAGVRLEVTRRIRRSRRGLRLVVLAPRFLAWPQLCIRIKQERAMRNLPKEKTAMTLFMKQPLGLAFVTLLAAQATASTAWAQVQAAPPIDGVIGKVQSVTDSAIDVQTPAGVVHVDFKQPLTTYKQVPSDLSHVTAAS